MEIVKAKKVLSDEKVDVIGVNTHSNKQDQTADMTLITEINDLDQLGKVMDKIKFATKAGQ